MIVRVNHGAPRLRRVFPDGRGSDLKSGDTFMGMEFDSASPPPVHGKSNEWELVTLC